MNPDLGEAERRPRLVDKVVDLILRAEAEARSRRPIEVSATAVLRARRCGVVRLPGADQPDGLRFDLALDELDAGEQRGVRFPVEPETVDGGRVAKCAIQELIETRDLHGLEPTVDVLLRRRKD